MGKKAAARRRRREQRELRGHTAPVVPAVHMPPKPQPRPQERLRDALTGESLPPERLAGALIYCIRDQSAHADRALHTRYSPRLHDLYSVGRITDADGRLDNPHAYLAGNADPEVSARPIRLHTTRVEGNLGGHQFSAAFARYLAKVKPRLVVVQDMQVYYWWASAYGRERVKRGFIRRYGEQRGGERFHVALCRAAGYRDAQGVRDATACALETRYGAYWAWEQANIAQRLARARTA